jgi:hypothetical protein
MCADREIRKFRKSTGCRKIHPSVNQVTQGLGDAAHNRLHLPEERRSPDVGGLQSMARLSISHSSRNNDKAIAVRDWLAANGWDVVFLDLDPERDIVAGQRWKEALQQAAHRCEVVLALVSAEWLASSWCKSEIDAARLVDKKIIVALIGLDKRHVPVDLIDEQFIDLIGDPQAWARLKEGFEPCWPPERAVISGQYGLARALHQITSETRFAGEFRQRDDLPRSRADIEDFIKTEGGLVTLFDALRDIGQVPGLSGENPSPPTIVLALDQGEELFNEEGRDE